jgi:hypothetical protein
MDEAKQYKTAGAFRVALETRLRTRARDEKTDLQRLRRQVAFDRLLARLFSKGPAAKYPWVLKGGYAMELRIQSARTTKDIDLTLHDGTQLSKNPQERREQVRAMVQEAAAAAIPDYFASDSPAKKWMARRKAAAVIPSKRGWMAGSSLGSTWTWESATR